MATLPSPTGATARAALFAAVLVALVAVAFGVADGDNRATADPTTAASATTSTAVDTTTATTEPTTMSSTAAPDPTSALDTGSEIVDAVRAALLEARIADEGAPVPYIRDEYDGPDGWGDSDGDCQNDRHAVLIGESLIEVTLSANGCYVETGEWLDPYTGTRSMLASDVTIDHTVPLAAAHRSGAWAWDLDTKAAFAADLSEPSTLVAVGADTNQSKGDATPDEWRPPLREAWCGYAVSWTRVKERWGLTYTETEVDALLEMLETCDEPSSNTASTGRASSSVDTLLPLVPAPVTTSTLPPATTTTIEQSGEGRVELVSCDRYAEVVTIANPGAAAVTLSGFSLHDEGDKHRYSLSGTLEAGTSLDILTGPDAEPRSGAVVWKNQHVWNNDGDTAFLVAPDGETVESRC